ncbi:hypothetical protein Gohar_025478 [Gossypium harknessii]|nr:hypothetical protein [Gossypium harknessii]
MMSFGLLARDHDGFVLGGARVFWRLTLVLNGPSCRRWLKAWSWRGRKDGSNWSRNWNVRI